MTDYLQSHPRALASFSSDPLAWVFGDLYASSHSDYMGWLPFAFMTVGLVGLLRRQRFWAICFGAILISAGIFALGPVLHVRGSPVFEGLPYRALLFVPVFDLMRLPHRWMLLVLAASLPFIASATRHYSALFAAFLIGEVVWFLHRRSLSLKSWNPVSLTNTKE